MRHCCRCDRASIKCRLVKLSNDMICPKCGKEVPADAVFCPYCGEKVTRLEKREEIAIERLHPAISAAGWLSISYGVAGLLLTHLAISALSLLETLVQRISETFYYPMTIPPELTSLAIFMAVISAVYAILIVGGGMLLSASRVGAYISIAASLVATCFGLIIFAKLPGLFTAAFLSMEAIPTILLVVLIYRGFSYLR